MRMSCRAEIDTVDEREWHHLLEAFVDANIYQTWAYGSARWGDRNVGRAVIRQGTEVIGLAQTVTFSVPYFGGVLAYSQFGPLWQRRNGPRDIGQYRSVVRALGDEYVTRRGLCLRLQPWQHQTVTAGMAEAMRAEEIWKQIGSSHSTFVLDLSQPLTVIRSNLDRKWRSNLRKAERQDLAVGQESGEGAVEVFLELSRQTQTRKRFESGFGRFWPRLYASLPRELKPRLFMCRRDGKPLAAAIVSVIGDLAFYLNGASGDLGLEVRAGFLLQWEVVRWLKEKGECRWYDLNGGLSTPGVRRFKRGVVGSEARATAMSGFQACGKPRNSWLTHLGTSLHTAGRDVRTFLKRSAIRT